VGDGLRGQVASVVSSPTLSGCLATVGILAYVMPAATRVVGDGEGGMWVATWEVVWSRQLPPPPILFDGSEVHGTDDKCTTSMSRSG
jgi:hypothetical protein